MAQIYEFSDEVFIRLDQIVECSKQLHDTRYSIRYTLAGNAAANYMQFYNADRRDEVYEELKRLIKEL